MYYIFNEPNKAKSFHLSEFNNIYTIVTKVSVIQAN